VFFYVAMYTFIKEYPGKTVQNSSKLGFFLGKNVFLKIKKQMALEFITCFL